MSRPPEQQATDSPSSRHPTGSRDRWFAGLWLLLFIGCLLFCTEHVRHRQPFYSNILDLLPQDERDPASNALTTALAERFGDRALILLQDDGSAASLARAQALREAVERSALLAVDEPASTLQRALIALYRPYSQQLLSAERRAWLATTAADELARQTWREFFSPLSTPRPYPFAEDPFNLGGHWLAQLTPATAITHRRGIPLVGAAGEQADGPRGDEQWFLIAIKLLGSPYSLALQRELTEVLRQFRQRYPDAALLASGIALHTAAGTARARYEIATVGLGSLLGIIALVGWAFRSPLPLLAVLLSLGSGCLLALTVSLLVFDRIHLLTLVFGSTLLGIAVDYVFHFLIACRRTGSGGSARRLLRHAMAVGALSTVGAFLLQLSAPFPGLRQMAVFSSAGLIGAWLTVLALAPFYRPPGRAPIGPGAQRLYARLAPSYRRLRRTPGKVAGAVCVLAASAVASILYGGTNDSIAQLNTSPAALIDSHSRVQHLLQQPSTNRFFLVRADSEETLLQRLQELSDAINQLNRALAARDEAPVQLRSLNQFVPSRAQQAADRALVEHRLYGRDGALPQLCELLGMRCEALFERGAIERRQHVPDILLPSTLLASDAQLLAPPLLHEPVTHAPLAWGPEPSQWQSLVLLAGNSGHPQLARLAEPIPGARFIDRVDDLSRLLGRYREGMARILLLTLGLLGLLLGLRYRARCWRALSPLGTALLITLGVAALEGITVFHLMALLLVLGIGIDTAVVYLEVGLSGDSWLASTLSSATSMLAFGLLSLSQVPILHQFGSVILAGILSCWLLTPLFFTPHPSSINSRGATGSPYEH